MLYLGLGSNLGDKQAYLKLAISVIENRIGRIVCQSAYYETEPWGYVSSNTYLNAVIAVETNLMPMDVLDITQDIERELGRKQKSTEGGYADRPIDIDLLLMDDWVMQTERLTLPHPLMHQRLFVMEPLVEIAPTLIHPVLKKTICQIYNTLKL